MELEDAEEDSAGLFVQLHVEAGEGLSALLLKAALVPPGLSMTASEKSAPGRPPPPSGRTPSARPSGTPGIWGAKGMIP